MNTIEQAHELLTEAREARTGSDAETSRHMSALVLATLAVAEQQRAANLIALAAPQPVLNGGEVSIPSYDAEGVLRDDIREALGL